METERTLRQGSQGNPERDACADQEAERLFQGRERKFRREGEGLLRCMWAGCHARAGAREISLGLSYLFLVLTHVLGG